MLIPTQQLINVKFWRNASECKHGCILSVIISPFTCLSSSLCHQALSKYHKLFQNQRSLAKKRKEDEADGITLAASTSSSAENNNELRTYSAFPPPSNHPSLGLPPYPGHSSAPVSRAHRSLSISPSLDGRSPRRSSSRHSTTPYSSSITSFSRPRRSRPEPYQLDALKDLFTKTATPSIEERTALALEIGM